MFQQKTENFGSFEKLRVFDRKSGMAFSCIPGYGGCLTELVLMHKGAPVSILNGYQSYRELIQDPRFKNAWLMPFPNRLRGGKYKFEEKEFRMPLNEKEKGNALHGFVYKQGMVVDDITLDEGYAEVSLLYEYDGKYPGYPFYFDALITYIISAEEGFTCNIQVNNVDEYSFPFGTGFHPYFDLGTEVDNLKLNLPQVINKILDKKQIPTGEEEPFDKYKKPKKIGKATFDHCFKLQPENELEETLIKNPENGLELTVWQETGKQKYNFLQVFTPEERKSIAIEPMTCNVNAFNNKEGLIVLEPEEGFEASFGFNIN